MEQPYEDLVVPGNLEVAAGVFFSLAFLCSHRLISKVGAAVPGSRYRACAAGVEVTGLGSWMRESSKDLCHGWGNPAQGAETLGDWGVCLEGGGFRRLGAPMAGTTDYPACPPIAELLASLVVVFRYYQYPWTSPSPLVAPRGTSSGLARRLTSKAVQPIKLDVPAPWLGGERLLLLVCPLLPSLLSSAPCLDTAFLSLSLPHHHQIRPGLTSSV